MPIAELIIIVEQIPQSVLLAFAVMAVVLIAIYMPEW